MCVCVLLSSGDVFLQCLSLKECDPSVSSFYVFPCKECQRVELSTSRTDSASWYRHFQSSSCYRWSDGSTNLWNSHQHKILEFLSRPPPPPTWRFQSSEVEQNNQNRIHSQQEASRCVVSVVEMTCKAQDAVFSLFSLIIIDQCFLLPKNVLKKPTLSSRVQSILE